MSASAPSESTEESPPPPAENQDSSPAAVSESSLPPSSSPSPPSQSSKPDSSPSTSLTDTPPPTDDSSSSQPPPSNSDTSPPPLLKSSPPLPPSNSDSSPPSPLSNSNPSLPSDTASSPPSPPSNSDSSPPSPPSNSDSPPPPPSSDSSPPSLESPPGSLDSPPNDSNQSTPPPSKSSPSGDSSPSSDSHQSQTVSPSVSKTPSSKQSPPSTDSPPETPSDVPTPPTRNNRASPSRPAPTSQSSEGTPQLSLPSTKSDSSSSKPPSSKSSSESSKDSGQGVVVGIAILGVAIFVLFAILFLILRKRKRRPDPHMDHRRPPNAYSGKSDGYYYGQPPPRTSSHHDPYNGVTSHVSYSSGHGSNYGSNRGHGSNSGLMEPSAMGNSKSWFSYEELIGITNGFSRQNVLGEGGFGYVYKGQLQDGKEVAVKQLKAGSGQGEREFQAEVEIISRVHHRHLVSLVGYCIAEHHRLLVYEFVPNNTLEHHLHGKGDVFIDWPKRVKIAIGAAKGLAYLHEDCHPRIIHRDIKSANILLDNSFEAQVADFGLAKLSNDTHTHVSTRVMGTFGYLAPEYASSGKLTDRSDVFSFGVVLLELVTGRKPVDASQPLGEESLVEWARPLLIRALETGEFGELVDPRLENNFKTSEMFRMIEVAAACVRHSASKRPRMVQVVRALDSEGDMVDLTNGVKFGQSTVFEAGQYSVDIRRFQRMAFASGDLSSEYGASGEYDKKSSTYSGEHRSREMAQRPPHSWKGSEPSSGEYPNGSESETRAMFQRGSGRCSDEFSHQLRV